MSFIRIFILLLAIPLTSFDQINPTDYGFLNQALPQIKKFDFPYFILMEETYPGSFFESRIKIYSEELKGIITPEMVTEFFESSKEKKVEGQWPLKFNPRLISKKVRAKVVTGKFVDSMQRTQNTSTDLPFYRRFFYYCSLPVFDKNKTYAVIDFGGGVDRLKFLGAKYLFKKVYEQWVLIAEFDHWVT